MQISDLPMYPSWDLTVPPLPSRSRLYSLIPFGVGTARVETLASYLVRLAQAHCLPVSLLIRCELAFRYILRQQSRQLSRDDACDSAWRLVRSHPAILQGKTAEDWLAANDQVEQIVRLLEQLTLRSDLRYLTLLPLKQFFRLHNILRREQCWCPLCYQQWRDAGLALHASLLWTLEPVCVCPYHHCYTQIWCTYCDQPQPVLSHDTDLGHCTTCKQWLGYDHPPLSHPASTDRNWEWHLWVAEALGQILAAMPILSDLEHQAPSPKRGCKPELIKFLQRCHDSHLIPVEQLFVQRGIL